MKIKKLLLLSWGKFGIILAGEVAFVILHNIMSGVTGIEDAVFFILAIFIIPVYFIISFIYSIVYTIKTKTK